MKTVHDIVRACHERAEAMGMEVTLPQLAFLISLFFEGMANSPDETGKLNSWFQTLAEEIAATKELRCPKPRERKIWPPAGCD